MSFILAQRANVPARIALTGPTNAGKTLSSLYLAYGIVKANFPDLDDTELWKKIAFIDTERGRGKFYINRTDLPHHTGQFYYMEIQAPYTSIKYNQAIKQADELVGEGGVILTDSLSHAWNYEGGILDRKSSKDAQGGNSYANWAEFTKEHNQMITTILSTKANTIVTMRSKMDYVIEMNDKGRAAPRKVGLKPIQREDTEFEFDITLMLDDQHHAYIVKDTTVLSQFADLSGDIGLIHPDLGRIIVEWLNQGIDSKELIQAEKEKMVAEVQTIAKANPIALEWFKTQYRGKKVADLDYNSVKEVLERMRELS